MSDSRDLLRKLKNGNSASGPVPRNIISGKRKAKEFDSLQAVMMHEDCILTNQGSDVLQWMFSFSGWLTVIGHQLLGTYFMSLWSVISANCAYSICNQRAFRSFIINIFGTSLLPAEHRPCWRHIKVHIYIIMSSQRRDSLQVRACNWTKYVSRNMFSGI